MLTGRYELKFPITVQQKHRFLEAARDRLQPDPHGTNAVYRVSSQYFDTSDFAAYWEKVDGEAIRKKYRLRYYSVEAGRQAHVGAAFMEIKHRINNTVYKERVRLSDDGAEKILSDSKQLVHLADHVVGEDRAKQSTIDSVVRAASVPGFAAANVITYLREAWMGQEDDQRLRLTFDTRCQAYSPSQYLDVNSEAGSSVLPGNMFIMEIKFNHAIPCWIREIVASHGVTLQRFSKYAVGGESLGIYGGTRRKQTETHHRDMTTVSSSSICEPQIVGEREAVVRQAA